jgi:hypothetical protein
VKKVATYFNILFRITYFIPFTILGHYAEADTLTAATVGTSDFDTVCQSTLAAPATTTPTDKLHQCQAAATSRTAVKADKDLTALWGAVAGVCAVACVSSMAGIGTNQYVCAGANIAGTIADGVISKNFASALMSGAMGVGTSLITNQMASGVAKAGTKPKDYGACLSAASAAYQAHGKYQAIQSDEDQEKTDLQQAVKDNSLPGTAPFIANSALTDPGATAGSSGATANTTLPTTPSTTSAILTSAAACNGPATSGVMIQCAMASDASIPSFVGSQQFQNELVKNSGGDLASLAGKSAGAAIMTAAGGALSPDQLKTLASAVKGMEQSFASQVASAQYSSGGSGGTAGAGDGGDPNMTKMMSTLMGQFMPKNADGTEQKSGMAMVIFANQKRSPASVAEDKTLNLFDRISYRYYFVGKSFSGGQ